MTILFDWKKIHKASGGKVKNIFLILKCLTTKAKPFNKRGMAYNFYNTDFSGDSYLLNPELLLKYSHCYTLKELAQYIALASYRNYAEYKMAGVTTLKLTSCPVTLEKIKENRLLEIKNGVIHFLFEEVKKEKT